MKSSVPALVTKDPNAKLGKRVLETDADEDEEDHLEDVLGAKNGDEDDEIDDTAAL